MFSPESPEQVTSGKPAPDSPLSRFFNDAYTDVATDIKALATCIEEHPREAIAIGAMAVGAAAVLCLTKGRALTGLFKGGLGEEVTSGISANPDLVATIEAASSSAKEPVGKWFGESLERGAAEGSEYKYVPYRTVGATPGGEEAGQVMTTTKNDFASFAGDEDPHGPDPHDEQHDPNLPANQWDQEMKPPADPYGGDPFGNL